MKLTLGEKRARRNLGLDGEWVRDAEIDREAPGVELLRLQIVLRRGRQVRIPYKPRGQNVGFHWWGDVYDRDTAHCLWSGRVPKSYGVRGILRKAELI